MYDFAFVYILHSPTQILHHVHNHKYFLILFLSNINNTSVTNLLTLVLDFLYVKALNDKHGGFHGSLRLASPG